jgi:hypothetical protein
MFDAEVEDRAVTTSFSKNKGGLWFQGRVKWTTVSQGVFLMVSNVMYYISIRNLSCT